MSNCCYNPMVYCWMNSRFRSGFKYVFRWCPCINMDRHGNNHAISSSKMRRMHTFVANMDLQPNSCGGNKQKDKLNVHHHHHHHHRGGNKTAVSYSPPLRAGIYRGEMYSSVYSEENIALQNNTGNGNGGSSGSSRSNHNCVKAGEPTPQPCRLLTERTYTPSNFNGYERLPLSNTDMT